MYKVVLVAILCAFIIVFLKNINSELTTLAIVGSGIIILGFAIDYLSKTLELFTTVFELTGLEDNILTIIFKITAIGYIVEFGAGAIEDMGLNSLANKLVFVGKIVILSVSLPIIYSLINLIKSLVV